MAMVRAKQPFATEFLGYSMVIQPHDIWSDDDPIVRAHPDQFEPVRVTAGIGVEQATAAPGEMRNVRRPR